MPRPSSSAHSTATNWHEDHINNHNAPTCGGHPPRCTWIPPRQYRYFNVTNLVKTAIAGGEDTVSFCIRGNSSGNAFKFDSKEGAYGAILYLYAVNSLTVLPPRPGVSAPPRPRPAWPGRRHRRRSTG